jgi:uncharacterized membrane protein
MINFDVNLLYMIQSVISAFSGFPPELATFLVAMTPVLEQRVALPMAIIAFNMPVWKALLITLAGNLLPITALLYFADNFHRWVEKNSGTFFGRSWLKSLRHAQDKFARYEKYGLLGLAIFIALPIPGSGIFTGTMIAFLMGVPFKHSLPYIWAAVIGSSFVTMFISIGIDKVF